MHVAVACTALALLSACPHDGRVPRSVLDELRAANNSFALAVREADRAVADRYLTITNDAIARGDAEGYRREREAQEHRVALLRDLRDLAFAGERLLDAAERGGRVLAEIRSWAGTMRVRLAALVAEVRAMRAAVPPSLDAALAALVRLETP